MSDASIPHCDVCHEPDYACKCDDLPDDEITYTVEEIKAAVNACCTCGGKGPNDLDACPACHVWHELKEY